MKAYQHTQSHPDFVIIMIGLSLATAIGAVVVPQLLPAVPLLLLLAWRFQSCTVEIVGGELRWRFGSGWFRGTVAVKDIISARAVRASLSGWGIRYSCFPRTEGVSGFNAVAVVMWNGRRFCLGSDEPEILAANLAGAADGEERGQSSSSRSA